MPLVIKDKKAKKKPHLALTHKDQGYSANNRPTSLLMKSGVEITPEITKALESLGVSGLVNKSMFASKISEALSSAVREAFGDDDHWLYVEDYNDSIVLFCSEGGLFSVDYSLVDGKVTLGDLAKPMTRSISYEPTTGEMLLSEDAEDKLEEGIYSLVTKALQNKDTQEHLKLVFEAQELKKSEVEILEQEIKKAVEAAEKILKSQLQEAEMELLKTKEELQLLKTEKEEAVTKARKAAIADVEKDEAVADELLKSLQPLSDDAFAVVIKSMKTKEEKVEHSDLLKEVGSKGREVTPEKPEGANKTADLLKAQFQKEGAK